MNYSQREHCILFNHTLADGGKVVHNCIRVLPVKVKQNARERKTEKKREGKWRDRRLASAPCAVYLAAWKIEMTVELIARWQDEAGWQAGRQAGYAAVARMYIFLAMRQLQLKWQQSGALHDDNLQLSNVSAASAVAKTVSVQCRETDKETNVTPYKINKLWKPQPWRTSAGTAVA